MSLVHIGVDAWVVAALLGAEESTFGADVVVEGTDAVEEVVEPDEAVAVLGVVLVLEVRCGPEPEVVLLHPTSATAAMSRTSGGCVLLRVIGVSC